VSPNGLRRVGWVNIDELGSKPVSQDGERAVEADRAQGLVDAGYQFHAGHLAMLSGQLVPNYTD
jgi:hypothetical protein